MGAILCVAPSCVFDSARRPLVDVDLTAASAYVFRGQTFTERPVGQLETLVQLGTRDGGAVSVGGFGNMDLAGSIGDAWAVAGHSGEFTQLDVWAGYARRVGDLDVALGLRHYSWPAGEGFRFAPFPATSEVFARVGGAALGCDASLTAHYDVDATRSLYVRGALERAFTLRRDLTLEAGLWLGWGDADHGEWLYRTRATGLTDAGAAVNLRLDLDDVTSARLGVAASTIVDSDLRDWFAPRIDPDVTWATAGVSWAF
ncbi:MAG: hypothetical protein R3F49_18385 [Planctomycetota bacterium]